MLTFITRRLAAGAAILVVATFLMYLLVDVSMDPLADLRTSTAPNKHLDTPVVLRYFSWLGGVGRCVIGQCDLGEAWRSGQAVSTLISSAIISTLQLVTASTILAIVLGVSVGIVSALRQYTSFDYLITFLSFLLYSLPSFWVAVLLKQWGAIGFNDFLEDPVLETAVLVGASALTGLFWTLAIGGDARRRLTTFGAAAGASLAALAYLQLSGWWTTPNIGPALLLVTGLGIAFGVTTLSTGLRNRRALYSALSAVGLGLALYYPMQYFFYYVPMTWPLAIGLGLVTIAVGIGIGYAWGGPDRRQSARTSAITSFLVAGLIFIDRIMQVWPEYYNSQTIKGRPIATFGDRTPNLGGDFWVQTLDSFTHLVLPTMTLVLIAFAGYTRYSRGSMLEVMGQDYIRTARAKGLTERTVVMRHGFRNSLIPLATIVPLDVVGLLGGAIITENIFGRPGMGQLFIRSLNNAEIEPVMAYLAIIAAAAIMANIVADLIYAGLDPRIRVNA
jgi:peptide/nickel transport system permease protein